MNHPDSRAFDTTMPRRETAAYFEKTAQASELAARALSSVGGDPVLRPKYMRINHPYPFEAHGHRLLAITPDGDRLLVFQLK